MIGKVKKIIVNIIALANVLSIVLMLVVGYSDRLSPEHYPQLSWVGMAFPAVVALNLLFLPVWVLVSWRRLLIPVAGLLLAYPPLRVYMPLHPRETPPEGALRIISYNVCGYGGNYKYEHALDTVLAFLKSQKPDIVCLQEDMNSKKKDIHLERFAEYFPYNDTTNVSGNPKLTNSLGIHTRFPIIRKEVIPYHSATNGSVAYFLQVGADTIIVINNHLESSHLSTSDRTRYQEMLKGEVGSDTVQAESRELIKKLSAGIQIRAHHVDIIQQYVEAHRQYPIISCGDFNDTPISYTRRTMAKGLTDCYVETGCGLGLSFNRRGFNFRIDHMMCSEHFTPYSCEIDNNIDYSDHYPLLCWLKFDNKAAK